MRNDLVLETRRKTLLESFKSKFMFEPSFRDRCGRDFVSETVKNCQGCFALN